jgi:hypothetical protein
MRTAAIERHALRTVAFAPALALAGLTALLFARLWPDVGGKPLHEDEAVAGLISARPLGDVLHTVLLDRGGAPLHFLLAHAALAVNARPEALRWVSVVFALATVPLCYDLSRRIAGPVAGLVAAALAATSQLLLIYGTFGRMYSLFAFASALAVDLFVRALERPQRGAALAAAAGALLPLAVHPFGAFLFAAEAAVALWLWRGQTLRAALPVLSVALVALPLLLVDLRLSDRYAPEAGQNLDSGISAGTATLHALGGAAGGRGVALAFFVALAAAGVFALARRRPAVAGLAVLTVAVPPTALAIASAAGLTTDRLGPRHLIFMLPLCTRSDRRLRAADDSDGSAGSRRGARGLARAATGAARRPVSLLARVPSRPPRREKSTLVRARAGGACPRRETHGRNACALHVNPVASGGQRRRPAASRRSVSRLSFVAHPRFTRPVRER